MFNAYVTHTQMKEYLALLIHNGLLEYQKEESRLNYTKGLGFSTCIQADEQPVETITEPDRLTDVMIEQGQVTNVKQDSIYQ